MKILYCILGEIIQVHQQKDNRPVEAYNVDLDKNMKTELRITYCT